MGERNNDKKWRFLELKASLLEALKSLRSTLSCRMGPLDPARLALGLVLLGKEETLNR